MARPGATYAVLLAAVAVAVCWPTSVHAAIRCQDIVVNPDNTTCNSATVNATELYSSTNAAVNVTLAPPGPYTTGETTVTVTPSDGTAACNSTVTVRDAANITANNTCFYPNSTIEDQLCIPVDLIASAVSNCAGTTTLTANACNVTYPATGNCTVEGTKICIPAATFKATRLRPVAATVGVLATTTAAAGGAATPSNDTVAITVRSRTINPIRRFALRRCTAV